MVLPKALNIIRPSSPFLKFQPDYSTTTASTFSSSPSTMSTVSNTSFNSHPIHIHGIGVNPYRFLTRPKSRNSITATIVSDDLDTIDGLSEEEEEEEIKVVAKIKNGTILNGKGEFLNKGREESWLDEARANRKIADLEIEKASLLSLNTTLETKLKQQTSQINELQKKLQLLESKQLEDFLFDDENTVVSNEDEDVEHDQVFQRLKSMIENLILQAEVALIQKCNKESKKVLQTEQQEKQFHVQETLNKLTSSNSTSSSTTSSTISSSSRKSYKRQTISSLQNFNTIKMSRTPSRQSSPPVLLTTSRTRKSRELKWQN